MVQRVKRGERLRRQIEGAEERNNAVSKRAGIVDRSLDKALALLDEMDKRDQQRVETPLREEDKR